MQTRSRARQAEEFRGILRSQNDQKESDDDDQVTDSESDHEEELEGSDEDNLNEIEDPASDDDIAEEAERMKRRRTSEAASGSTRGKFIYGKNRYKWSLNPPGPEEDPF